MGVIDTLLLAGVYTVSVVHTICLYSAGRCYTGGINLGSHRGLVAMAVLDLHSTLSLIGGCDIGGCQDFVNKITHTPDACR